MAMTVPAAPRPTVRLRPKLEAPPRIGDQRDELELPFVPCANGCSRYLQVEGGVIMEW